MKKSTAAITQLLPYVHLVTVDTRTMKKGSVYFAIAGKNLDGHDYVSDALARGARYVVVSRAVRVAAVDRDRVIRVPDTTEFLGQLALAYRHTLTLPIIGIGGSNGKTTTKELLRTVLASTYDVHYSPSSFNNNIGVPLTILSITKQHDIAVVELGTNHPGELSVLTTIARPTHAIVTSIGKEHLEGFGTMAAVVAEEAGLYADVAANDGVLFVPSNVPELRSWARVAPITYGSPTDTTHVVSIEKYFPGVSCTIRDGASTVAISSQLSGSVNAQNILAVYTIARYFGVSIPNIKKAIRSYTPAMLRSMMIKRGGSDYFVDCYNANPSSMYHTITDMIATNHRQKIAVIGGMRELGSAAPREHAALSRLLRTGDWHHIYYIGTEFAALRRKLLPNESWFESYAECAEAWKLQPLPKNSLVCIKGSKGIKLWRLLGLPDPT